MNKQNKSITTQKEHGFIIETASATTSKTAPASKNVTLYEGMRELLQVINAITEKALQSLATKLLQILPYMLIIVANYGMSFLI